MGLPAGVTEDAATDYLSSKVDADPSHILQETGAPLGLQYRITQNFTGALLLMLMPVVRSGLR